MNKRYQTKTAQRRSSNGSKPILLVVLSFLCGYLTSSILNIEQLGHWINLNLFEKTASVGKPAVNGAPQPKPKLEFYTLLTNGQHHSLSTKKTEPAAPPVVQKTVAPQPKSETANKLPPVITASATVLQQEITPALSKEEHRQETYQIQVASFKNKKEAERMKASLILKGFSTDIVTVNQQQTLWYRVMIGPFPSRVQAEKMLSVIAKNERIKGMIHRMNT